MKKKIQKYLAGEREGFSLVELIIVIAIMAILIGVIALAVIPNIQRSRESKDLTTLDNIMSACNTAAANARMKKNDTVTVTYPQNGGAPTFTDATPNGAFTKQYKDAIGENGQTLSSSVGSGKDIIATVTIDANNVAHIVVKANGTDADITCKYTTDDNGNAQLLKVESGSSTT